MTRRSTTRDQRTALQRQVLPRKVPGAVRRGVLLGAGITQVGWAMFGFGMIFFWGFTLQSDLGSLLRFRGELETAQGTIMDVRSTNASINERRVHANDYRFRAADGAEHGGTSYSTRVYKAGAKVTIEHPAGRPEISRIVGQRAAIFPAPVGLVGLIPAVGLLLIVLGMRSGMNRNWLLANGRLAPGVLRSREATGATVNKRPVYKLTFDFQAANGRTFQAVARTHLVENLMDEAEELVLYDPRQPGRATLVDGLPMKVQFDERGVIVGHGRSARLALILPVLVIGGHALYVCLRWF
jgi:hypothetical protein